MKRKLGLLLVSGLVLVGCEASSTSTTQYESAVAPAVMDRSGINTLEMEGYQGVEIYNGGSYSVENQVIDASYSLEDDTKLIRSASVSIETVDYDKDYEKLTDIIGGYTTQIRNRSETVAGGTYIYGPYQPTEREFRQLYLNIKIASTDLDQFVEELKTVGTPIDVNMGTYDSTQSFVDNESRIEQIDARLETLLRLMDEARSMEDVITIESKIADLNDEKERLMGMNQTIQDDVTYSDVSINLTETFRETPLYEENYDNRVAQAFREMRVEYTNLAKDLGIYTIRHLPSIIILVGILALLAWVGKRDRKKYRTNKSNKTTSGYKQPVKTNKETEAKKPVMTNPGAVTKTEVNTDAKVEPGTITKTVADKDNAYTKVTKTDDGIDLTQMEDEE